MCTHPRNKPLTAPYRSLRTNTQRIGSSPLITVLIPAIHQTAFLRISFNDTTLDFFWLRHIFCSPQTSLHGGKRFTDNRPARYPIPRLQNDHECSPCTFSDWLSRSPSQKPVARFMKSDIFKSNGLYICLLYTSPSPRDLSTSRMPSSA